ncbi:PPE domain-containing protein [Nocardia grenadensis]|uniref:PPE domain-containing protein n=1 Tax=Nocardia grenadensis TaxID=931537 RepID=UPI003D90C3A9
MVEPPVIGFTGVVWPARPTEQLSRDLTTGPGAAPMAEASRAWTQLAATFGAAVIEYEQIMIGLRESWRSPESEAVLERITGLRDWLVDAAAAAGRNAGHAGGHAVAYEVARLAMPHIVEVAALEDLKQSVEQAGAALGAPLVAVAAQVDGEQSLARANAARVMQSYESATTSLADPWTQQRPPVIATSAALEAEQSTARATASVVGPATAGGRFAVLPGRAVSRAKVAYRARTVAQSVSAPEVVPAKSLAASSDSAASRMSPGGMGPAAGALGALGDGDRVGRAGAVGTPRPGAALNLEAGFDAAPPVLGAAERMSAPQAEARP